jgi:hypothetical protein
MKINKKMALAALLLSCTTALWAADAAPAPAADSVASAVAKRAPKKARANVYNTPGWQLMSKQERQEHRDKMRGMKSFDDCQAYITQHHADMEARAKEQGKSLSGQARHDVCNYLKKK